jgi:hypothetical protein
LKKVSVRLLRAETKPTHLPEDLVGGFGPLEGLSFLVVGVEVGGDRGTKLRNAGVRSTSMGLIRFRRRQMKGGYDGADGRGLEEAAAAA